MRLTRYQHSMESAWNDFVATSRNGLFLFDRRFMEYHSDRFEDHSLVFLNAAGAFMGVMPANIVNGVLWSHQGLTFGGIVAGMKTTMSDTLDMFALLRAYLRENGIISLKYKPVPHAYHRCPAEEDLYALFQNGAVLSRVDASACIRLDRVAAYSKGRKHSIKKALRHGLQVEESQDYSAYMTLLGEVLRERHSGSPVHSATELELLQSRFPDNIRLVTAKLEGKILAGTVIFMHGTVIRTQYLMNTAEGRQKGALDIVIDHLLQLFGTSGHSFFDFGTSAAGDGSANLNHGLMQQKEHFGARTVVQYIFELTP